MGLADTALAISPLKSPLVDDTGVRLDVFSPASMVLFWVAGFDVIYALQDIDFDRSHGLHSIPSKLGWSGAA